MSPVVRLRERQHLDLTRDTWTALSREDEFWTLIGQQILRVTHPARGAVRVEATRYVGRAYIGEHLIEIEEKAPGAVRSLLRFASAGAFKIERLKAPATELGDLMGLLVSQFLAAVLAYASTGRDGRYDVRHERGSLIGGRLNLVRTVDLRARGMPHLVAFDRPIFSNATDLNRLVLAALIEVERLSRAVEISSGDLASARGLSIVFEDCRDTQVLFGARSSFVQLAERFGADIRLPELVRDMSSLAGVLLTRVSFEPSAPFPVPPIPRSWFLNLESLFERAIRQVLRNALRGGAAVTKGTRTRPKIFSNVSGEFSANPDLVLHAPGRATVVGDVKYKLWTGSAIPSDLYQLIAHAGAFGAEDAFLVFPHESFESRYLGEDSRGCRTWLFGVDVRNLSDDLHQLAARLGFVSLASP